MPKEYEDLVKKLKKNPKVDNPYALGHYILNKNASIDLAFSSIKIAQLGDNQRMEIEQANKEILEKRLMKMQDDLPIKYQIKSEIEKRMESDPEDPAMKEELKRIDSDIEYLISDMLRLDNTIKGKPSDYTMVKSASGILPFSIVKPLKLNFAAVRLARLKVLSTKMAVKEQLPRPVFTDINNVNQYAYVSRKLRQGRAATVLKLASIKELLNK